MGESSNGSLLPRLGIRTLGFRIDRDELTSEIQSANLSEFDRTESHLERVFRKAPPLIRDCRIGY